MTNREERSVTAWECLARRPFGEREIQDAIACLREHAVARGAENPIDAASLARVCARDWRLFHTVYDNTVTLERVLDHYLPAEEARRVWQRVEVIQSELDRAPKSLMWMLNQVFRKPTQVPA